MKIYKVTFLRYTNSNKDTVWDHNRDEYLSVGNEPLLITEAQIESVRRFGGGIDAVVFVGNLLDEGV